MTQDAMFGDVDNGHVAKVESAFYTGRAGVREDNSGMQVAYIGKPPVVLPANLKIDGKAYSAVARAQVTISGFVSLLCKAVEQG